MRASTSASQACGLSGLFCATVRMHAAERRNLKEDVMVEFELLRDAGVLTRASRLFCSAGRAASVAGLPMAPISVAADRSASARL